MIYKEYGSTGEKISAIGFGGMQFNNPDDIDANADIVLHAHERGVTYFDTAPGYCKDKSEVILGAAIKQMKPGTFYISTKSGHPDGGKVRESLEKSLKRLNVEKIDFFHIWCVLSTKDWQGRKDGGAVQAALKAKQEGLVRHVSISSHMSGGELAKVLSEGFFEGVTLGYCAINFPFREEAITAAGRLGLGVVTMNPLGGGLIPQHAKRFDFIRGQDDPTVVAAALRFNVSNPSITSAIVGFTTKDHVDQAIDAIEDFQPYSPAHVESMRERILDSFEGLCTGCGYCLPCPEGIEIPKMMDTYNMKIMMGGDEHMRDRLKWHWSIPPEHAAMCTQCGLCESRCTQHLPIRERMKEVAALANEDKEKE